MATLGRQFAPRFEGNQSLWQWHFIICNSNGVKAESTMNKPPSFAKQQVDLPPPLALVPPAPQTPAPARRHKAWLIGAFVSTAIIAGVGSLWWFTSSGSNVHYTTSARVSSEGDMARPIAFAVLRLTIILDLDRPGAGFIDVSQQPMIAIQRPVLPALPTRQGCPLLAIY